MNKKAVSTEQNRLLKAFRESESRLRSYMRRFTSNHHDVEDICQETILRAFEAVKSREVREPESFLFGVVRNIVRKELDKKSRALVDFVTDFTPDDHPSELPGVEDQLDESRRLDLYGKAIAKLPPHCQRVFLMKKVYGYSHKEIAAELNISTSTVEKHVAMGLKRCSDELAKLLKGQTSYGDVVKFPKLKKSRSNNTILDVET